MPNALASLSEEALSACLEILHQALPGLQAVYLFGSQAADSAAESSDVDVAVLAAESMPNLKRVDLGETLAAHLKRDVDLIDLREASTVLRSQVVARGRRLYAAPAFDADAFEDFVFADYARLNEERRGILEDIRRRGSIHAG